MIIIGIIVVVIAAAIIFYPTGRQHLAESGRAAVEIISIRKGGERTLAGMVPDRAGFFIRAHGISEAWDELIGSGFFREVTGSRLWEAARIEEKLAAFRDDFKDRNGFEINRSRIMELVGEDIALAILPATEASPDAILIISRVGLKTRLVEILARLGDGFQVGENRLLREEEYRGERIVLFSPTDSFPFFGAYTFIENYLVIALAPGTTRPVIEQVIDLVLEDAPGRALGNSPEFAGACRAVDIPSEFSLEWYFKPALLSRWGGDESVSSSSAAGIFSVMKWGREIINNLSAVRTAAGRIAYAGGIRSRVSVTFESEFTGDAYSAHPEGFPGYVPAGALLFAAFGSDPSLLWEKITAAIEYCARQGYTAPLTGLRGWERETGLSIKGDILPLLEGSVALVMEEITGRDFLPLPPTAVIVRVADQKKADEVMGRVAAWSAISHDLVPVKEEYGGMEMTLIPDLFFLQPGYVMIDTDLIIGSNRELLMKMIDLRNREGSGIETDRYYREITAVIDPDPGDFIYLNGERFVQSLLNLGEWYMAYQRIVPDGPLLPEDVYRDTIVPILNLCGICRAAGISVTRDKEVVKKDCFLYIP